MSFPLQINPAIAGMIMLIILAACGKTESKKTDKPSFAPKQPTMVAPSAKDTAVEDLKEQINMVQRRLDRAEQQLPPKK